MKQQPEDVAGCSKARRRAMPGYRASAPRRSTPTAAGVVRRRSDLVVALRALLRPLRASFGVFEPDAASATMLTMMKSAMRAAEA